MQRILARIDTNGDDCGVRLRHGMVLLLLPHTSMLARRAGARPVHPILGHAALPKGYNDLARVVDFLPCRSRKDDVRSAGGRDAADCGMAPEAWSRAIRSPLCRERHYLCDFA